jgi:hypothetical protein
MSTVLGFAGTGGVHVVVYCDYYKSLGPRVFEDLLRVFMYGLHDHDSHDRHRRLFASHPAAMRGSAGE